VKFHRLRLEDRTRAIACKPFKDTSAQPSNKKKGSLTMMFTNSFVGKITGLDGSRAKARR
jgi:hypothetical protein